MTARPKILLPSFAVSQRTLEVVFWSLLALVLMVTLPDYGMGWDEPTRWASGDLKLDYYAGFATTDSVWEHMRAAPRDTYPGFFDMPLALAARWLPFDRFFLGHLWSCVFGVAGLVAVRLLAARPMPEAVKRPVGLGAAAILVLLPNYYGHLFINPKDIPFAATMAWGLLALYNFVEALPLPGWKQTILLGVGTGIAMSTRLPGGILLVYAGLLALLFLLYRLSEGKGLKIPLMLAASLAVRGLLAGLVAFLVLLPWWPAAHRNPFAMSVEAVGRLHTDSAAIPVLFAGEMFEAGNTPASYGVRMLFLTSPLWFLAFLGAAGAALIAWARRRRTEERPPGSLNAGGWGVAAVVLAAGFPLVYVSLAQPAIHNGFRHLLYVLPPLAVLASWGASEGWKWLRTRGFRRRILCLGVGATLGAGIFTLVRLHPYQYVYLNPLAGGTAGLYGRYETEYWFTSTKHGIELLEAYLGEHPEERVEDRALRVFITGPHQVARPFLPSDWEIALDVSAADFVISNTQMVVHLLFEGEEVGRIERSGLPILFVYRGPGTAME
jgi:hypothetical protein